ncbi:S-adenosyl-l-methionine hydroxide adenosyltransferase family protein [Virgibacillus salarius]|uniref:SAM hydrolase/SAM-dependent halogenase family protein n=1 Tax=Virgibacillus salarius TaxID=447199 RepID=UPI0031DE52E2
MCKHLVLQTDFGIGDGAVSAMYGVAISVDPELRIFDLTHDIPPYNIWEASYRLYQTITYWPEATIFISVVDPGVGTDRLSVVVKTMDNKYIVTPNNGTLTHIKEHLGIAEVRVIDEKINRLPRSGHSYTFHGRDVYVYTGARLASAIIDFEEVGPKVDVDVIIRMPKPEAKIEEEIVKGHIDILDIRFGNLWTNINRTLFAEAGIRYDDVLDVTIMNHSQQVYKNSMTFSQSFAKSRLGEPLVYVNSLDKLGIALNQGSFAKTYQIGTGENWEIWITKVSST